jgi:hypothetical protein
MTKEHDPTDALVLGITLLPRNETLRSSLPQLDSILTCQEFSTKSEP